MTSSLKTEWAILKRKIKEKLIRKKNKQQKKKASYNKQKEATDKGNKHTYNLCCLKKVLHLTTNDNFNSKCLRLILVIFGTNSSE